MSRCKKGIAGPGDWNKESVIYDPHILIKTVKAKRETKYFADNKIYKLGEPVHEKYKKPHMIKRQGKQHIPW